MVDVDDQLQARYVVADFAHVHRFVVMARLAPNELAGTVGHYQGIAAAHRHDKPSVFGPFGQTYDTPAIRVPAVPPTLFSAWKTQRTEPSGLSAA